jgi:hypothetical protein
VDVVKRTPLRRGAPMRRRSRLRSRNPERAAARREVAFGAQAALCRELACSACGLRVPTEPDHVRTRGAGGRDEDTVPLCRTCHDYRHANGHGGMVWRVLAVDLRPWVHEALRVWRTNKPAVYVRLYFEHVARGLRAVVSISQALKDDRR